MADAEIAGYLFATLIGLSLGLIGGGGSILTVPILVYIVSIEPVLATAYSLFIVGITSLAGTIGFVRKKLVSFKTALLFGIPSFVAVFISRRFILPSVPESINLFGIVSFSKNTAVLLFFAVVMLLAAVSMIRSGTGKIEAPTSERQYRYPLIVADGFLVGIITGLVGAGGGFLIIPALVLLVRLPMKLAIGTSLTIITIKSLIGFLGDIRPDQTIDWQFLLIFSAFTITGVLVGIQLSSRLKGSTLQQYFGWFVLVMAIAILLKEII